MAQLTIKNYFSQMMNFEAVPAATLTERLIVNEHQHHTLSNKATSIRILSGIAWISYMGKDIVLKTGDTLKLEPSRDIAILTSLGHKPVELELSL
jgi:hypothetical protein